MGEYMRIGSARIGGKFFGHRGKQSPENGGRVQKRKPRRRLSGIGAFLLAFCACSTVFVAAFTAFVHTETGSRGAASGGTQLQAAEDLSDSYNLLFATADDGTGKLLQCLLLRLEPAQSRVTVAALPPTLLMQTAAGRQTLSGVRLSGGMSSVAEKLQAQYGLRIRFTCLTTAAALSQAVDSMGGIVGTVPASRSVQLPGDAHPTVLAAGRQLLNGKKTTALITDAPSGQNAGALALQSALMRDFLIQKLTPTYTSDPAAFYRQTLDDADTRFSMNDLLSALSFIRSFRAVRADFAESVSPAFTDAGQGDGGVQLTESGRALLRDRFSAGH
jgi:anionic cell wall polymer biosynthesis LytR-Cps2A-Psr (LCP) family protein